MHLLASLKYLEMEIIKFVYENYSCMVYIYLSLFQSYFVQIKQFIKYEMIKTGMLQTECGIFYCVNSIVGLSLFLTYALGLFYYMEFCLLTMQIRWHQNIFSFFNFFFQLSIMTWNISVTGSMPKPRFL